MINPLWWTFEVKLQLQHFPASFYRDVFNLCLHIFGIFFLFLSCVNKKHKSKIICGYEK